MAAVLMMQQCCRNLGAGMCINEMITAPPSFRPIECSCMLRPQHIAHDVSDAKHRHACTLHLTCCPNDCHRQSRACEVAWLLAIPTRRSRG